MKSLIAIVGPTASGKSNLALSLAKSFKIEIINADSRQVYRHMSIGTAKPDQRQRKLVPHHLYDIVDPDEPFSISVYQREALRCIEEIKQRKNLPIIVGGTGLYIQATLEKWTIPAVAPDLTLRRLLENRAELEGHGTLYEELKRVDPISAKRIMPTNIRRVIRALEIYHHTGNGVPLQKKTITSGIDQPLIIGLTMERQKLYKRIDSRVDLMIKEGLIDEVKSLLKRGYNLALPSMSGIGYREIGQYLRGERTLEDAVMRIKYRTHNLARKQYAWFRLNDERIKWFDVGSGIQDNDNIEKIKDMIGDYIGDYY